MCVCCVVSCVVFVMAHGMRLMRGTYRGSDNALGAKGAAAVAGAVSKLVNLTSLLLGCTWNVEWLLLCVYVVFCVRLMVVVVGVPCVYVVLCRVPCLSWYTGCG